jgi:hypothetical protein
MLVSALFIILTVVALPALNVSSITATRICSIVLASISVMSYNALASLTINSGISLYNELIQVTSTTYIIDILLGIIGSIALIA